MKIKGIVFRELVGSQGFLVPVQYTNERLTNGLEVGKAYNIEITEAEIEESEAA